MNWCEESKLVRLPVLLTGADNQAPDDEASEQTPEPEQEQNPKDGFGDLPATKKVPSLEKLLAGDARRNPETEKPGDEKPN